MTAQPHWEVAFRALGDSTRLKIFQVLMQEERCACQLQDLFDFTQPTISYHMRILTEAGLVTSRKEGCLTCYKVKPAIAKAMENLLQVLSQSVTNDGADSEP